MITSDQLKDVLERADALKRYLNIDQKKVEFEEEQLPISGKTLSAPRSR